MTDRELHELAAKAAGIEVWWTEHYGGVLLRCATSPVIWRPLKDDSDALRLAVQLQIEIRVFNGKAHAGKQGQFWCTEQCDSDPCAATRRAIVRAAARIWTKVEAEHALVAGVSAPASLGPALYPLDADPEGIRARVADAISGALAFGAQNSGKPPAGHWLAPFWMQARFGVIQFNALRDSAYALLDAPAANALDASTFEQRMSDWAQADALDAARYRYLRDEHEGEAESLCVFGPNDMRECLVPIGSLPGELDAFIDAAIAAQTAAKEGGAA